MYNKIRVFFKDGSETEMYVPAGDNIPAFIASRCKEEGWDVANVIDFSIQGTLLDIVHTYPGEIVEVPAPQQL